MLKFDPATQLSSKDASELILEIVENGELVLTPHAKKRMKERGYSMQDVIFILTHGEVKSAEFDDQANNWKYKFCGND